MLQQSDLVDLDLQGLYKRCQAALPKPAVGMGSAAEFVSEHLLPAAKKGHPFSQYYIGRCYEQGVMPCTAFVQCMANGCELQQAEILPIASLACRNAETHTRLAFSWHSTL